MEELLGKSWTLGHRLFFPSVPVLSVWKKLDTSPKKLDTKALTGFISYVRLSALTSIVLYFSRRWN